MQRLVAVRLRNRDPVAHTLRVGDVAVADDGVDRPAELLLQLARAVDDDAQGEDVVDPFERHALFVHLGPDRVDRLCAALDVVFDPLTVHPLEDRLQKAADEGLTLLLGLLELRADMLVVLRLEVFQGDVLQFALQVVEAQLVGDLGVEVQALPALLAVLLAGEDIERAHHLQPVGQLDQDHPRILRVGDDQVAEVRRLLLGGLDLQFRDVAEPHRDAGHGLAEAALDVVHQQQKLLARPLLVGQPDHVVQDGRDGRVAAQADFRDDDAGHGGAVIQQGGAVVAQPAVEFLGGVVERLFDEQLRDGGEVRTNQLPERIVTGCIHTHKPLAEGGGAFGRKVSKYFGIWSVSESEKRPSDLFKGVCEPRRAGRRRRRSGAAPPR